MKTESGSQPSHKGEGVRAALAAPYSLPCEYRCRSGRIRRRCFRAGRHCANHQARAAGGERPEQYPAGANRDDTFYFCTACHGFKIVAAQGLSRERWSETFDFMVARHKMVDVQGEQREQMLDYLSTAFPERREGGGWKNPFAK